MTAAEFRDYLKTAASDFSYFYAGKIDRNKEKALCVYSRGGGEWQKALNGKETDHTAFSVLIHWNKNYTDTEAAAQTLFTSLEGMRNADTGYSLIDYIEMNMGAPEDLHTDESGIYERIIDFTVFSHDKPDQKEGI